MYHPQSIQSTRQNSAIATPVRSGSPEMIEETGPINRLNPFATPYGSVPHSRNASTTALQQPDTRWFHSRRVKKGSVERPWLNKKDPKEKWVTIIPIAGILLGLAVTGVLIWDGLRSVVNHVYCPVLQENWSNGINNNIWVKEAEVGGFG